MDKKKKKALEEKQYEVAMEGNVQMLIWLGKQHLGQTDKEKEHNVRPIDEICFKGI